MSVAGQITLGSVFLFGCIFLHVIVLMSTVKVLRRHGARREGLATKFGLRALGIALAGIVASHTVQIWALAISVIALGALSTLEAGIYFALVTYTTLGYGDLTLTEAFRVFGAFGSVTGLLAFGLSTAFLVGLFTRLLAEPSP